VDRKLPTGRLNKQKAYFKNAKVLIMSVLRINQRSLEALFIVRSMRGSQIQFGREVERADLAGDCARKMINPHFPSLAFVASFLAVFGRLDPFDPRLMYVWMPFSISWRVSVAEGYEKGRRSESCAMAIAER
jgi:hypothetical protein